MLLHNLSMAMRQLTKYKLQTLLSLVGLAVGFTCFALSSLWWRYETTYDSFHPGAENLYIQVTSTNKWATVFPSTHYSAAQQAMEKIPQVELATVFDRTPLLINESAPAWISAVDSLFLNVFQPKLVVGSYPQMHPDGTMAVVTDKLAMKLFGTTDCIGREVSLAIQPATPETYTGTMWENGTYTIAAVVKEWGNHSCFPFDCIVPFRAGKIAEYAKEDYLIYECQTVMRLHPTANADTVTALINKIRTSPIADSRIVPLTSIRTELPGMYSGLVKIGHIRIFALLGLLVVICAVFNYLSLYVIRIRMRARELALRIVCGSSRRQLLMLLVTEFLLLLLASCCIGLLFMGLTLPSFKEITRIAEDSSFFFTEMVIYLLVVTLGTLPILVGVTWWVQRQSLNGVLHKGQQAPHGQRSLFRPLSQWVQLSIGMGLVFFTSVVILQLHYLRTSTDIGFTYENRATFNCWNNPEKVEEMAHYLRSHPDVEEVKMGCNNIGNGVSKFGITDEQGNTAYIGYNPITRDEADFWGLELLAGRWMENHEKNVAMVNESAAKELNLTYPVDTVISSLEYRIVGVVRNVSAKSLIVPQEPTLYPLKNDHQKSQPNHYLSFSYRPGSWPTLCDSINSRFNGDVYLNGYYGDDWHLSHVDEEFNQLLHSEDTLLGLFYVMTAVCILIALFGVYSLITISCEQRRKEIAVRKVFGARVGDILRLFFGEQLVVLLLAALVGFPVAYVCVKPWLEGYIHQVEIPLWLCPAIFTGVALLVSLCIGWRVWRTANTHPADEICKG